GRCDVPVRISEARNDGSVLSIDHVIRGVAAGGSSPHVTVNIYGADVDLSLRKNVPVDLARVGCLKRHIPVAEDATACVEVDVLSIQVLDRNVPERVNRSELRVGLDRDVSVRANRRIRRRVVPEVNEPVREKTEITSVRR